MTITNVRADIVCDKCRVVVRLSGPRLVSIRREARQQGWDSTTGKDLCVMCANPPVAKGTK